MVLLTAKVPIPFDAKIYFLERNSKAFADFLFEKVQAKSETLKGWREGESFFWRLTAASEETEEEKAKRIEEAGGKDVGVGGAVDTMEFRDSLIKDGSYSVVISTELTNHKRIEINTKVTIQAADEADKCFQITEQDFKCKIFGLGMIAEGMAKRNFNSTSGKMEELGKEWAVVREELVATPEGRMMLLQGVPDLRHLPWVKKYVEDMLPPKATVTTDAHGLLKVQAGLASASLKKLRSMGKTEGDVTVTDEEASEAQKEWEGEGTKWMKEHVKPGEGLPKELATLSLSFKERNE